MSSSPPLPRSLLSSTTLADLERESLGESWRIVKGPNDYGGGKLSMSEGVTATELGEEVMVAEGGGEEATMGE